MTVTESQAAPMAPARAVEGYEASWFGPEESRTPVGHWVYRGARTGPSVIVIHEANGLSRRTLGVAARIRDAGMTPVLPLLAGSPLPRSARERVGIFARLCVMREFGALTGGEATPTAAWLRALALGERDATGLPVGVVGMCFSGGYALAAALEPAVKAIVASQPAFPWAIGPWRRRFGVNPGDIDRLKAITDDGACVRTLRYERDFMSPKVRHRAIAEALPKREAVELPATSIFKHPVTTDGVDADPESPVGQALTNTIEFLRARLL